MDKQMKKPIRRAIAIILACLTPMAAARAMTRDEMRAAYAEIVSAATDEHVFDSEPDPRDFTTVGELNAAKTENALAYMNFLRAIAGLDRVEIDEIYSMRAQHAACLLAANDRISHSPGRAEKIGDLAYETAYAGAAESDLAKLQWQRPENLLEGISYFARDDGEMNAGSLPHRRWLLDPAMRSTGFGLAYSKSGNAYIAVYAVDGARYESDRAYVAWPAEGLFPAEMMREGLAWSVCLNDRYYSAAQSNIRVTMTETESGETYVFDNDPETGAGAYMIDAQAYGTGVCVSWVPEAVRAYQQNQKWNIQIVGIVDAGGREAAISYETEMISLTRQAAVNVEATPQKLSLKIGERATITATVIPAWADDRTVRRESSDENIATVDADGNVTAIAKGKCEIYCIGEGGIKDTCAVEVN